MAWTEVVRPRKRIVHVITESGPFGGAQRNTLLTVKGLSRDEYPVELVCGPGGRLIPEAEAAGIPVHVVVDLVRQPSPLRDLKALFQLRRLFQSKGCLLVHTHSTKAGLLGRVAARLAGVPFVVHTYHGPPFEIDKRLRARIYILLERLVGRMTDRLVCVGEVLRQEITAWQVAPEEKLVTVYSGLEISAYSPLLSIPEMKQRLGLEKAWPIIGCIGRLTEAKCQHYLVDAVRILKENHPRIKLLLVGEGELRSLLEGQIRNHNLATHVSLLGERDDIADLLNVFDIYAMSSRWEGVGRALSEAMLWGLPIVATPVNGVREVIIHEGTGLLVPPRDPPAVAQAIDRLACSAELAKRLGSNAQKKVRDLMDGEKMILDLERLYGQITGYQFHGEGTTAVRWMRDVRTG